MGIDTNILAYAEGLEGVPADLEKIAISRSLLDHLYASDEPPCVPAQALAELFHLLVRKSGVARTEAAVRLSRIRALSQFVPTDEMVLDAAMSLTAEHGLQIYDAIIVAAAHVAECGIVLSEDMQDGFTWRGVMVRNPFSR